jgi:hypothetical protein
MKAILRKRVIVSDQLIFDAEREMELPIPPFVGLRLNDTESKTRGGDESEDLVEMVACNPNTGQVYCYLPHDDFRPESSGGHWTEEDVRECYRDWAITPDLLLQN